MQDAILSLIQFRCVARLLDDLTNRRVLEVSRVGDIALSQFENFGRRRTHARRLLIAIGG